MRIVHSANTAQPRPVAPPFSRRSSQSSRVVEEVMFLACSARSSNLRLLPELFAVPFIASTMKSPEKRVSLLTASKMERKIAKRSCYWTGNGAERGRKKRAEEKGEETYCRVLLGYKRRRRAGGKKKHLDGLGRMCCVVLFPPSRHTSSTPFPVSPLRLFPISPSFFAKLSVTLDNNNSNEGDDDDRPANGIKGKNILGAPRKRLRCLYTLQSAPFGRLLASES